MENFKSNSNKTLEKENEEKKIEKVVQGTVRTKKKSGISKVTDVFLSEDVDSVKNYILMDVLVPALKKAISDIVTNGIDMILYGESGKNTTRSSASKISYRSYYDNNRRETPITRNRTSSYSYDEIIFESRGEAEEVLSRMDELIMQYGFVSVADLNDLVGVTGNYTDNKYGWSNLRNSTVVRIREGYIIKFPKVMPLD